jgi:hypothetical protein
MHLSDASTAEGKIEAAAMVQSLKKRLENVRSWVKKGFTENIYIDDKLQTDKSWDSTWRGIFCK